MLKFLLKWIVLGVVVYLVWAMIFTRTEGDAPAGVSRADMLDRLVEHTGILRDARGADLIEPKVESGEIDGWLSAALLHTGALVMISAGEPPDSAACRRCLKYIQAASLIDTLNSEAGQLLAYTLWRLGNSEAAIISGERAVSRLAPGDTSLAPAWLGGLYLESGRPDSALASFRHQLMLDPENEAYYESVRGYIMGAGLPDDTLEAVLSLSAVHTGLFKKAGRTYNEIITWPRRKLAGLFDGKN